MNERDGIILLGQIDQHNSHLVEAGKLRAAIEARAPWQSRAALASTAALPLLLLALTLLPFHPMGALLILLLAGVLTWALSLASMMLGAPEEGLRRLEKEHDSYVESVLGRGRYLHIRRHGGSDVYSVAIHSKETDEVLLDLGTTEGLPLDVEIMG